MAGLVADAGTTEPAVEQRRAAGSAAASSLT